MEDRFLRFRKQVEALRTDQYNLETAAIVIDNLKVQIAAGLLTWQDLGTSSGELELIFAKIKMKLSK
jgi:hypothetical protein